FQAEDGIRDFHVTGVQTCALPIFAKGLTSAYAPLSGSIIGDRVWKVLERGTDENGPIGHGWTYSAHPIGAAAGVANLKLIDELRSEERRVGKEGRSQSWRLHYEIK